MRPSAIKEPANPQYPIPQHPNTSTPRPRLSRSSSRSRAYRGREVREPELPGRQRSAILAEFGDGGEWENERMGISEMNREPPPAKSDRCQNLTGAGRLCLAPCILTLC